MGTHTGIWVIVEAVSGQPNDISQELFTPARRLGDKLGQPVTGVVLSAPGDDTAALEQKLGHLGADNVLSLKHELLGQYQTEAFTRALSQLVEERKPNIVLIPATTNGRDFSPRLAIRVGAGLVSDATDLDILEDQIVDATKPCFAEAVLSSVRATQARPQMITVRGKVFPKPVPETSRNAAVETVTPNLSADVARTKLLEVAQSNVKGGRKLEDAEIIVAGGRGLKSAEHFNLIEELAETLGAGVGASRAVVDAGWRPHSEQVGQTGKSVRPQIYFAIGISGAIQHQVGMSNSKMIIAVNRDADAPIFKIADFGIVGDVFEVVPELTKTLKEQNLAISV